MATLASPVSSPWIPEDDLLLKNAVEAGASLEALAKGAVRFSRKFTFAELRDRWHSLLYDPVISAEASARMVEFELSTPNLPLKFNRSGNSKESAEVPAKRKVESIRKLYYALRKRTCNSTNQSFLDSPNVNDCIGYGSGCQEHVRLHDKPSVESCVLGDCVQNHFGFEEMGVDILHHGAQGYRPQGILRKNCFNAVSEKVPSWSVKESVKNDSYKQNDAHKDIPHILGDGANDFGNSSGVEGGGQSHALPDNSSSFQSMGYSSPQPGVPLWKTIEDISAPSMPVDVSHGDKNHDVEETLAAPDVMDGEKITSSGFDVVHLGPMVKHRHVNDEINTIAISESDFVDLPDSLLNFANEDELFMDADDKTTVDKSCCDSLGSLLLNTPNDVCEDDVSHVKEPQTFVSNKSESLANPDGACPTELEVIIDPSHSGHDDQHSICCSEVNIPSSTSVPNPHSPELHDEMMDCTLNSEDPEIPCNDDILLGKAFASSIIQTGRTEAGDLTSSFANKKNSEQERNLRKKEDNLAQSFTASRMLGSQMLPETSPHAPHVRHGVKPEFPGDNYYAEVSTQANITHAGPSQCRSTLAAPDSAADGVLKKESLYACNETDVPLHAKSSSTISIPKPEANPSTPDQEESLNQEEPESEDDIPYFSDIEAMILEMDLCPDDPDSCISREVNARYQDEDTKRTIIRLEQSARSSMHRAIASQGALAILYGHHLKHYIKETEVILGRATDDVEVDIDLGREGPANKISRRQALIKMEGDGSFILKNLGKGSIFLNGKEVATGLHMSLSSSSLIEIRDMSFVFEINHKSVRRYLVNVAKRNQAVNNKFEWSEEGVP